MKSRVRHPPLPTSLPLALPLALLFPSSGHQVLSGCNQRVAATKATRTEGSGWAHWLEISFSQFFSLLFGQNARALLGFCPLASPHWSTFFQHHQFVIFPSKVRTQEHRVSKGLALLSAASLPTKKTLLTNPHGPPAGIASSEQGVEQGVGRALLFAAFLTASHPLVALFCQLKGVAGFCATSPFAPKNLSRGHTSLPTTKKTRPAASSEQGVGLAAPKREVRGPSWALAQEGGGGEFYCRGGHHACSPDQWHATCWTLGGGGHTPSVGLQDRRATAGCGGAPAVWFYSPPCAF